MRPAPRDELEGIRRILADVVAPAVEGEYPQLVLQQALTALDRLAASWDRSLPVLLAENAALAETLGQVAAKVPGLHIQPPATAPASEGFAAIEAENRRLRGQLDQALRHLDAAQGSPSVDGARALIATVIRANLDRALTPSGG